MWYGMGGYSYRSGPRIQVDCGKRQNHMETNMAKRSAKTDELATLLPYPTYNVDQLIPLAKQRLRELGIEDGAINTYKMLPKIRREQLREYNTLVSNVTPTKSRQLRVTVRTNESEIFEPVVNRVSVDVVEN